MKGKISKIKNTKGELALPITTVEAVYMENGITKLSDEIKDVLRYEAFDDGNITAEIPSVIEEIDGIKKNISEFNSSLDNKANKDETQNIQQQINDLVLGAVGDGNNAEVVQARGGYTVLNDRLIGIEDKANFNYNKIIPTFTESSFIDKKKGTIMSMPANHYSSTDYIEVNDNLNYIVNTKMEDDSSGLAYYDKNKVFISGINLYSPKIQESELTLPKGTKYIRYSFHSNQGKNDSALSYLKEISNIETINKLSERIVNIEKNNLITANEIYFPYVRNVGNYINNTGKVIAYEKYYISDIIELKKGDKIRITSKDPSGNVVALMSECDDNGNILSVIYTASVELKTINYTAEKDIYIKFCGHIDENIRIEKIDIQVDDGLIEQIDIQVADRLIEKMSNDGMNKIIVPTFTESSFISFKNGTLNTMTANHYSSTNYIEVNDNFSYIVNTKMENDSSGLAYYDKNKKFISGVNLYTYKIQESELTLPKGTKYIRYSFHSNQGKNDSALSYLKEIYNVDGFSKIGKEINEIKDNQSINSINYWSYAIWKVLCIGDSLTSGASYKEGWGEMAGTGASIDQNYPRILGRMLNAEVTNAGNSGYSASDWYNKNFNKYNYGEYDTFLIWLGTNYGCSSMPTDEEISTFVPNQSDVASTSNQSLYLIKLINEIKAINPDSLIVLLNTFASKGNYITHNSVVKQIAEKYNLLLIDMSDLSPANRLDLHAGVNNPHFGIAGNVFIANRIVEELAKYFEENPLRCELTYWQRKN